MVVHVTYTVVKGLKSASDNATWLFVCLIVKEKRIAVDRELISYCDFSILSRNTSVQVHFFSYSLHCKNSIIIILRTVECNNSGMF